jgi:hypothetical protein
LIGSWISSSACIWWVHYYSASVVTKKLAIVVTPWQPQHVHEARKVLVYQVPQCN